MQAASAAALKQNFTEGRAGTLCNGYVVAQSDSKSPSGSVYESASTSDITYGIWIPGLQVLVQALSPPAR